MKIDLHVHTAEVSACGKIPAAEVVNMYLNTDYDAIVITDHMKAGDHSELENRNEWYVTGYNAAKKAAEGTKLRVIFGAEVRFWGGDEDFLLFGITPDDVPTLYGMLDREDMRLPEFIKFVRESGRMVLVQAHPFRKGLRAMPNEYLDGVEVYNGHPDHESHNELAHEKAEQGGKTFIKTSGSDAHKPHHVARGGIFTDIEIHDSLELAAWLKTHPEPERIETVP